MTTSNGTVRTGAVHVEQSSVIWAVPEHATSEPRLVIGLAPVPSAMETVLPDLERLAAAGFGVVRVAPFSAAGVSAGGDMAVAAAGLDRRIGCVAAIVATPDGQRPGTRVDGALAVAGEHAAYARFLYLRIDPLTNLCS